MDRRNIQGILNRIIEVVLDFKDREMYDKLALRYIKSGIFNILIKVIVQIKVLPEQEYKHVARILELCACHTEGIEVLHKYLTQVISLVDTFMRTTTFDLIQVRYPAATVLLDLTANEQCIEKVGTLIQQKNLLTVVIKELEKSLARKIPKNAPNRVFLNRHRDLMIGIVLNLTCNVENDEVSRHMVFDQDIIKMLKLILVDNRHDWPTNGSGLALLQYAHYSLSNSRFFEVLERHKI